MTTMLALLNASIECNNLGVVLYQRGDLQLALDAFMTAARLMDAVSKQLPASDTCGMDPCLHSGGQEQAGFEIPFEIRRIVQESANLLANHGKRIFTDGASANVEAVTLDFVSRLPMTSTLQSAVVTYNMGLVFQLHSTEASLQMAIFLFDRAFSLAHALRDNEKAVSVAMGSLNNAGEIFHSFGEYTLSRSYLDTLRDFVVQLPKEGNRKSLERRQHYLLNAFFLHPPYAASSA